MLLSGRYPQRRGSSLIPDGSAKGSDTCTKSGSGEDDIHTEGGGEEDGFDTLLTQMAAVVSTVAACTVFTRWKWRRRQRAVMTFLCRQLREPPTQEGSGNYVMTVSENNFKSEGMILKERFGYTTQPCWRGCL